MNKSHNSLKIFAHLAHGYDADYWRLRWESGKLIGTNDPTPYGYGRAEKMGCDVVFSKDVPESFLGKYVRLAVRLILGFDYLHARRNASEIFKSEVVWTHTESQFLAVALLFHLHGRNKRRPKIIGQSVWLFDKWQTYTLIHRAFFSFLIDSVDILTVHSRENERIARKLFPKKLIEVVPFGIAEQNKTPVSVRINTRPEVLSVGNDVHRDWSTAVEALKVCSDIDLTIISSTANPKIASGLPNVKIIRVKSNSELKAAFDRATLMLVPLKANHHASGITVIQEAALHGLPVIATKTGGLEDYFDNEAVTYVPVGDDVSMRLAIKELIKNPSEAAKKALIAQQRMGVGGLGADSYIAQHVRLSHQLLN